jgi:hypothetical protein
MSMPTLLVEVTQTWEEVAAAEVIRVMVVHAVETSAQEAATSRESAMTLVKDAKDQTTLEEREAWERVSRVEVESATALASPRDEAEGLVWKIAFLRVRLRRCTRLEGWTRRTPVACPM